MAGSSMDAWEVGVSLMMESDAVDEIKKIGQAFTGLHLKNKEAQALMDTLTQKVGVTKESFLQLGRAILTSMAVTGVGLGIISSLKQMTELAKDLNNQFVKLNLMGVDPGVQKQVADRARQAVQNTRGVTQGDYYKSAGQALPFFPADEALNIADLGTKYNKISRNTAEHGHYKDDSFQKIMRAGENMGRFTDPKTGKYSEERVRNFVNQVWQMKQATHGLFNEDKLEGLSQQSGISARSWTDQGLKEAMAMTTIQGGHRVGTAQMSLNQQFQAGRMPVAVANALVGMGILKPGAIQHAGGDQAAIGHEAFAHPGVHGHVQGIRRGHDGLSGAKGRYRGTTINTDDSAFVDPAFAKALRDGPVEAAKMFSQAFDKAGIHGLEAQLKALSQVLGRSTTYRYIGEALANQFAIKRDVEMADKAKGVDESNEYLDKNHLVTAQNNLGKAWKELAETFMGPEGQAMIPILNALTEGVRSFSNVLKQFDPGTLQAITTGLMGIGVTLAVSGTVYGALAVSGWLIGGLTALGTGTLASGGVLALALGPAGWFVAGLAGIATAFVLLKPTLEGVIESLRKGMESLGEKMMKNGQVPTLGGGINYEGGNGLRGLIHPASLGGGGDHVYSDIGRGHMVPNAPSAGAAEQAARRLGAEHGAVASGTTAPILDAISAMEGTRGYSDSFGHQLHEDLTGKTIEQVQAIQRGMHGSSAIGRYQFMSATIKDLIKRGVISPTDKFDGATQDKMANAQLQKHGLDKWRSGEMSDAQFLHGVAGEWAGVPQANGHGRYEGVGLNRALGGGPAKVQAMLKAFKAMRDGTSGAASGPIAHNDNAHGGAATEAGVNTDLLRVINRAREISKVPFHVHEGLRSLEEQRANVAKGWSKTMNSQHLHGLAVDVRADGDPAVGALNRAKYAEINRAIQQASRESKVPVKWGGNWPGFPDVPHFELPRGYKSRVPPSGEAGKMTQVHTSINLDNRKVGSAVTRHMAELGNGPSHGGQGFDRTRTFAGNDSGFRTAV